MYHTIENLREQIAQELKESSNLLVTDIENDVHMYIEGICDSSDLDVNLIEVFLVGNLNDSESAENDISVIVEYSGTFKEDALFNILHESEFRLANRVIDINPIRECESGTLQSYLKLLNKQLSLQELKVF